MKWRIGDYTACSDSDMLFGNGVQHKLERRAMEALVFMCAHAGQVVKKDELIEAVWGRLAVSDHSVAMVISQLRRALGDDARAPTYIETITKRGYRLIASCEAVTETVVPIPPPAVVARAIGMPVAVGSQVMLALFAALTLASAGALSAVLLLS
jgi:DNA-binding winged helix-turn-helix (wHTH) protein